MNSEQNRGNIYKLYSSNSDKIYIGSTTQEIKERKKQHIYNYKNNKKNIMSSEILDKGGNIEIELLECVIFTDKNELLKKEGEYIKRNIDICVNKRVEGRQPSEYYRDNRETIREKQRIYYIDYYEKNKDKKKQTCKEYYYRTKEQKSNN